MLDKVTLWRFIVTFSWALEALQIETNGIWSPEELKWPKMLRNGQSIPDSASIRIIEDRLALVCQDFFRDLLCDELDYWKAIAAVKAQIFTFPTRNASGQ